MHNSRGGDGTVKSCGTDGRGETNNALIICGGKRGKNGFGRIRTDSDTNICLAEEITRKCIDRER